LLYELIMSNARILIETVQGDSHAAAGWANRYGVADCVKQVLPSRTCTQLVLAVTTDHWLWKHVESMSPLYSPPVTHNRRSTDK
jgi:hypothetical protein